MRASRVAVGVKVEIISGEDAGKFGIIEAVKDGLIAVRAVDGDHARHYKSGQLHIAIPEAWENRMNIMKAAAILEAKNAAKKAKR